jgi:hypothetical protein
VRGETRFKALLKDAAHLSAPRGNARALIVLGCQRSGTDALIECFEHDPNAKVYPEFSSLNTASGSFSPRDSVRFTLRLLPLGEVARRLERVRYPLAVMKPLVESQHLAELLAAIPRSQVIWLFRAPLDVAESNVRAFGADVHRRNLAPIASADSTNWRSERTSAAVQSFVARHYRPDMDPIDGGALFWWARNQLLFDSGMFADPRVLTLDYARFVADPTGVLSQIYEWTGVEFPGDQIARSVRRSFVGRGSEHAISGEIKERCDQLWKRLVETEGPQGAS